MRVVACSGFPVPVSRYWKEFTAVEVTETETRLPGAGTVRRWVRESPEGFVFTFRAPAAFAQAGFQLDEELGSLLSEVSALSETLRARAIVFAAGETFKHNRLTRSAVRRFIGALPDDFPTPVLDFPSWSMTQKLEVTADSRAAVAYDPLKDTRPKSQPLHYLTLTGPAGHRSRYDDGSIDKIFESIASIKRGEFMCVFRNIDMHANASTLWKRIKTIEPVEKPPKKTSSASA